MQMETTDVAEGGCLSSDNVATSAIDSAFDVSNALRGFADTIEPGLESSKVAFDALYSGLVAFWPTLNCLGADCASGSTCAGFASPQLGYICS